MNKISNALNEIEIEMECKAYIPKLIEQGYSVYHTEEPNLVLAFCHDCYVFFKHCLEYSTYDNCSLEKFILSYNSGMSFEFAKFYACECMNRLLFMLT